MDGAVRVLMISIPGVTPVEIKGEYRRAIDPWRPLSLCRNSIYHRGFLRGLFLEHFQYGMGFYANQQQK
jgi:hypothetical protein